MSAAPLARRASLGRRLGSSLYDLLLNVTIAMVATLPFIVLAGDATGGWKRHALQLWDIAWIGAYYVWFWTHGGQTLPMQTWRIRIVRAADGGPVNTGRAIHRYVLAVLGFVALGLGFAWALVDRERQFLHDRLAGTAIVDAR